MSTRKTTATAAAAAAAAKSENASVKSNNTTATATITTPIPALTSIASGAEKAEHMGSNASTASTGGGVTTGGDAKCSADSETAATRSTTPTIKEAKQFGNEPKRITRNSPLLLPSPSTSNAPTIATSGASKTEKCDPVEPTTNSESEDSSSKRSLLIRGRKSLKEAKENKETVDKEKSKLTGEATDTAKTEKDMKDGKETKETKEKEKDTKDIKEGKEEKVPPAATASSNTNASSSSVNSTPSGDASKTATSAATAITTTNRLTRKSIANEPTSSTRVTRNRQTSNNRPETPPAVMARSRRSNAGKRASAEATTTATALANKRRHADDDSAATTETAISAKQIKIEAKDECDAADDDLPPPASTSSVHEPDNVKIKQELIESDESATEAASTTSNSTRSRSRWSVRKSQQLNLQSSPSTRATRNTKNVSPSPSPTTSSASSASGGSGVLTDSKRRRLTLSNTAARSSGGKCAAHVVQNAPDDDSKDSMASSSVDEIPIIDIKIEKFTPDLIEDANMELEMNEKCATSTANGVAEPLTVNTEQSDETEAPKTNKVDGSSLLITPPSVEASTSAGEASNGNVKSTGEGSEKSASLSPEMVSEGVSEISVTQFYKKPKFLENNLGIEEDPKLGEIVQKVSTEKVVGAESGNEKEIASTEGVNEEAESKLEIETNDCEDEDMKEGTLRLDDSNEEKKGLSNDDAISVSTGNLSPLIIEEDEEDAEGEGNVQVLDEEAMAVEIVEADAQDKPEEEDAEDDITIEESETISMDNNPSLPEDAREEFEEEVEEQEALEMNKQNEEKTKNECDRKAKLKIETFNDESKEKPKTEVETSTKKEESESNVKAESDVKTQKVEVIDENKEKKIVNVTTKESNTKILKLPGADATVEIKELKAVEDKSAEGELIVEALENVEDDEVLAKIDAALNEYQEKDKEKLKDEIQPIIGDENKENLVVVVLKAPTETMDEDLVEHMEIEEEEIKSENELAETQPHAHTEEEDVHMDTHTNEEEPSPNSSNNTSPSKPSSTHKDDDNTSMKSGQSTDTNSWVTLDYEHDEETLRQKEQHLQNLGLLTHKAAEQRRQEYIQSAAAAALEASRAPQQHHSGKRNGKSGANSAVSHEYTGTLKTVIKINRCPSTGHHTTAAGGSNNNGRKSNSGPNHQQQGSASKEHSNGSNVRRQSLKITFQKGRGRGQGHADRAADQHNQGEDAYYTIQNENEGVQKSNTSGHTAEHNTNANANTHTHGRKSYNRSNTTSHTNSTTNTATTDSSYSEGNDNAHHHNAASTSSSILHKKDEKEEILIPEKASSFKFHPGRLCDDQCFYCSGKFGLYDTPCHVGQIKSAERQQNILANEEKLTVDSCLCDACFRHVDRRANVPSYKKRLLATGHHDNAANTSASSNASFGSAVVDGSATAEGSAATADDLQSHKCLVPDCVNPAAHSLRRKSIRKSVKKFLLNFDMSGSQYIWLCQAHYEAVIQCSGCVLCKRRLGKNHMYHITSDTDRLEKALAEMGIPVQLGIGTAVCKLCRYFANLLMKPPDTTKSQKAEFVKNYRKRLLQFHNIRDGSNEASEADEDDSNGATLHTLDDQKSPANNKSTLPEDKSLEATDENAESKKDSPSPAGSSGSSVECVGDAAALTMPESALKQQMIIDNNVLVDYDGSTDSNSSSAPMSPQQQQQMSKLKAILQSNQSEASKSSSSSSSSAAAADISNVLRANPNISMRELFPGEEDLGLHFKAPFGSNSSQRTPEGWTRVQTFLQYDEATRRLWEELQKPYGNQSSFLRHLILLEKYYRNGDLVLSPHASSNASVYTQTVRQRLTSYDQGHCGGLMSAKPPNNRASTEGSDIPTVEINEDDDVIATDAGNDVSMDSSSHNDKGSGKRKRSVSVDKLTKQLSTNAVTIIARPKQSSAQSHESSPQKSLLKEKQAMEVNSNLAAATAAAAAALASATNTANMLSNSRSILKTNLLGMNKSVEILPISAAATNASSMSKVHGSAGGASNSNNSGSGSSTTETKQQKILEVANKLLENQMQAEAAAAASQNKASCSASAALLTSPPELVSLQRRSTGATTTMSSPASAPIAGPSAVTASLINNKRNQALAKSISSASASPTATATPSGSGSGSTKHNVTPPNVVKLPETLTPQERLQSRNWRPTLMPVEENQHLLNKSGPLYKTADGRRLPALVQVMSGGRPFLISIFDYNRMCILRREKLMRDQMLRLEKKDRTQKTNQQMHQQQLQQRQLQQQQQLHQHQAYQKQQQQSQMLAADNMRKKMENARQQQQLQQQGQQAAAQRLVNIPYLQSFAQAKAAAAKTRYTPIAPKPGTSGGAATNTNKSNNNSGTTSNIRTTIAPNVNVANVASTSSGANAFNAPMLPLLTNAFTNAAAAPPGNTNPQLANNSWLWRNFPDASMLLNGNLNQQVPKLPQLLQKGSTATAAATVTNDQQQPTPQQQQQQQMAIDNTLMSKIPKSLTVIPQHKLMNSAAAAAALSASNNLLGPNE